MRLSDLPAWFVIAFGVSFGLIWGSFLNVVIYRVPRGKSVVRPGSACPACGKPIRAWDNIPVFGFLMLRGRARCCGAKLSARYPLVELMGGVLAAAVLFVLVFPLPETTPIGMSLAVFASALALSLGMVAAAFIDLEHMILPDSITYGAAVLGLATASFRSMTFVDSLIGAAVGFAVVWVPFIVIYPRLRDGKVGMGLGDAKLMAAAGAWFGWPGALVVLGAGAVQGTVGALLQVALKGKIEEPEEVKKEREELRAEMEKMTPEERAEVERELAGDPLLEEAGDGMGNARVPFGPFLALAIIEYLFFGKRALDWFLMLSSP
ncbi:MAG: prepilin peptidase [Polyangiaceae bacterium]|nr:prepilin peptidase [Polyangiaceae bacterium]